MKLDLDNYVPGLLLWLSNRISASASGLYRSRFGVGLTEWRLLAYFIVYPWSTASKACELMERDKGAASRSVSVLLRQGWLEARPDGLRRVEYKASAAGRKLHDRIYVMAIKREDALMKGFSAEERVALIAMLHRLLRNIPAVSRVGRGDS
jgi:DNA-binding MarR family transcriptional regulator